MTDIDDLFELIPHLCHQCGGRLLLAADGATYRCSICRASGATAAELCCCSVSTADGRPLLECFIAPAGAAHEVLVRAA